MTMHMAPHWRIDPVGDRCLIVEFGRVVAPAINETVRDFARQLLDEPIAGVVDVVPAFTTVAIHYRPEFFAEGGSPYDVLSRQLDALLVRGIRRHGEDVRTVEIPVCYGGEFGPDLDEVAAACGLQPAQVIERHIASQHVVYMLGFAPGFPYIGGLDPSLAMPRRSTPRTRIPAGSVAIASDQTSIYSLETPGGWNVIGRTPLKLFDAGSKAPCLLRAGDRIRFVPVSAEVFGSAA